MLPASKPNINKPDAVQAKHVPFVFAVTSGKGGVGKTSLSVNLSIALAKRGRRVCLFDGDTGLANVNIMMGVSPPFSIEHVVSGEKPVGDVLYPTQAGIDLIPGATGVARCVELDESEQSLLIEGIQQLESNYDYFVVDTAAGISANVLQFVAAAQTAMVVITPEPTSLTDAFSLLKVLKRRGYKRTVQVIVNMAPAGAGDKRIYQRFAAAVKKYLDLPTAHLGTIWMDESMRNAVTLQRPVSLLPEHDPSCRSFVRLADRVEALFASGKTPRVPFSAFWQKVATRKAEIKQAKAQQALSSQVTTEASRFVQTGLDAEAQWAGLRQQIAAFVEQPTTTPEQLVTLISSSIYAAGDRVGDAGVDLVFALLQNLQASHFDDERRELMHEELIRLGLMRREHTRSHRHRYDEAGFGDQQQLVEKIRQASGQVPLDALLDSIRYASLVDRPVDVP